jgi:UDP-GlcNAc:undecaprenyl-phosphate GlcNAc-1-phosphate transferase
MGDAGSQFLGFWAICLSLKLTQGSYPYNKLLPLMLLGVPILDTLSVMCERISKRQSPFMPDKNHIHHKLVQLGFSHAETVFLIYMLQSILITSAYFMRSSNELPILACFLVFSTALLGCITVAERNKWLFKRYDFIDGFFKERLKTLRDRQIIIKVSFKIYETALPAMLLFSCLLPKKMPAYVAYSAAVFIGLIVFTWFARQRWVAGVLRLCLYLFVPYIVYFSDADPAVWIGKRIFQSYNLAFGVLVLFMILTLKFTRRQKGFKSTPLDFLILFVALVVPNLPDARIQGMSVVATKIIVFFFGYEVLVGEIRGERRNLVLVMASLLAIVAVRGFFGI